MQTKEQETLPLTTYQTKFNNERREKKEVDVIYMSYCKTVATSKES